MAKAEIISKKFYDLDKLKKFPYLVKRLFEQLIQIYKENIEPDHLELSTGELCKALNSSEKSLIYARKKLEEAGVITYENTGTRSPGIYKFAGVDEVNNLNNSNNSFDFPTFINGNHKPHSQNTNYYYDSGLIARPYYGYYTNMSNESNQCNFDFLKNINEEQLLESIPIFIVGGVIVYELSKNEINVEKLIKAVIVSGFMSLILNNVVRILWPKDSSKSLDQSTKSDSLSTYESEEK